MYPNPTNPVGVHVPYAQYVRHTFCRILSTIPPPSTQDFPLRFQIADGLDGSGSHIYNQANTNTELNHSFYSVSSQCRSLVVVVLNSGKITAQVRLFHNVPFSLLLGKKTKKNIRNLMTKLINPDTDQMQKEGFSLDDHQKVQIEIVLLMFDGKMAALLSGAGGASCQLCTTTRAQIKDRDFVLSHQ